MDKCKDTSSSRRSWKQACTAAVRARGWGCTRRSLALWKVRSMSFRSGPWRAGTTGGGPASPVRPAPPASFGRSREALSITTTRGRPLPPDPAGGAGRTSCAQGGRDPTGQTISSHLSIWNAQSQTACLATTVLMLESSAFGSFDNRPAGRCKAGPRGLACGAGYQLVRISPGITAKDKEKTVSQRRRGRPGLC